MVLDTCILIEILKGNSLVVEKVSTIKGPLQISAISVMELFYGAFNKEEQKVLEKFCSKFKVIQLTTEISKTSINLVAQYSKSHSLDIPDGLIAATCLVNRFSLFTLNGKDFKYIDGLELF